MYRYARKILCMVILCVVSLLLFDSVNVTAAKKRTTLNFTEKKIEVGESVVLKIKNGKGTPTWKSKNNKIKITKIGKDRIRITGRKTGMGYITVSIKNIKLRCKIKVIKPVIKIAIPATSEKSVKKYVKMLKNVGASVTVLKKDCDIKMYDGLVLPGGGDINPRLYKQENKGSKKIDNKVDYLQYSILRRFVQAEKPVLGICRGHQMINVYFNGTLNQDIKNHKSVNGGVKMHASNIKENSILGETYGSNLVVNSMHHQSIDILGDHLRVVQRSLHGTIEGVEHDSLPIIGVQWHPERMGDKGEILFEKFLSMCQQKENN